MLERILNDIDAHEDEIVAGLKRLIETPSSDGKATMAQEIVYEEFKKLGLETESFKGDIRPLMNYPDYCQSDIEFDENAYNVAGRLYSDNPLVDSIMLFGHIDTESEDYFGNFANPYKVRITDDRIYGLGSSDDKGGIAMMIYALKYLLKHVKKLPYDITLMSVLGKHGGAYGTLSAIHKGYTAVNSIYLHPAETGHGFKEIKNISLGIVDLNIDVYGKNGAMHDDLDPGINSNISAMRVVEALERLNETNRNKYIFDFGSFKGQSSYILNIGSIISDNGYGGISLHTSIKIRVRFFMPLTVKDVMDEIENVIADTLDEGMYRITKGNMCASPAMVANNHQFVKLIEDSITSISGESSFIHQYHGGSDIRLPIIYGNSNCVGIGPSCILPLKGSGEMEWISRKDYITGVKILATVLYKYQNYKGENNV